jgi:hypothetical protein
MKKFARWRRGMVLPVALAGVLALAGCASTPMARVTGTHGGMLPGMAPPGATLTSAQAAKLNAPQTLGQTTGVRLPDGGMRVDQTIGGALYSQAWYDKAGVEQHAVFYGPGNVPVSYYEFGPDGQLQRVTTWYAGTMQAQRVEEYDDQGKVTQFTEYWPNGKKRLTSEADVETPYGPVWRVEEWYDNGLPKSLTQRNEDGLLEGRQTQWDATGVVTSDIRYHAGAMQEDYLQQQQ